jgi:hypothetical protein
MTELVAVFATADDAALCHASSSIVFSISKTKQFCHCFPFSDHISIHNSFNSFNFSTPPVLRRVQTRKRPRPTTEAPRCRSKSGTRSLRRGRDSNHLIQPMVPCFKIPSMRSGHLKEARRTRLGLPGLLRSLLRSRLSGEKSGIATVRILRGGGLCETRSLRRWVSPPLRRPAAPAAHTPRIMVRCSVALGLYSTRTASESCLCSRWVSRQTWPRRDIDWLKYCLID